MLDGGHRSEEAGEEEEEAAVEALPSSREAVSLPNDAHLGHNNAFTDAILVKSKP